MLASYRALMPDASGSDVFCAYETDRMFRIPTVRLAEARFGHAAPTWHYLFDWPCAWNRRLRSCHVMEVPFVFGITGQPTGQFFTGGGEAAARLSGQVRTAWASFTAVEGLVRFATTPWVKANAASSPQGARSGAS